MWKRALGYLTLYGAHGLKVFSFILLIPHFTQIFSKAQWGQLLMVQALALWMQILVEYGFNLSATRSMARVRDDRAALAQLVAGVAGAKAVLAALAGVIAWIATDQVAALDGVGGLVFWATLFAIAQGFNPVWYFLAREQFAHYAGIDFVNRLLYLLLCLVLIRTPADAPLIFGLGIVTAMGANVFGYALIARQVPLTWPTLQGTRQALRQGFGLFLFVGVTSVYTTLNLVILGLSHTAALVAAYGTADRIVRASGGLLDPLNRIVYAKLSYLYQHDFAGALAFLRRAALVIVSAGTGLWLLGTVLAPQILALLAPTYTNAVPYLRLLLLFLPVLALNNVVGLHVMLPLGLDRAFNTVFLSVSVLSVAAMFLWVPRYGALGMGVITIATEALACAGMVYMTWRSGALDRGAVRVGHA